MANLTIRDLPDSAKEALRVSAAKAGISLESYARGILQEASRHRFTQPVNLLKLAKEYFGPENGVELELPTRGSDRPCVEFE